MDKFEINSCKKWIEDNNFHIIALQLPDEDLDKVQDLIDILTSSIQYDDIEFFLVGEGCSPCCNDLLNAQYCQAQGLIHFGHSCLAKDDNQPTISIFYVFYQQSLPDDAIKYLSTTNNQNKPYTLVFYDPCYRHAIEEYSPKSSHLIFSKIDTHNSTDSSNFSLYNRSVQLPLPFNPSNYSIIFISYSKSSLHNFALYFHSYDFHSFPTNSITSSKLLSKRMYAIECARNSSSYGLLLSSNSLLNLPITIHQLLDQVKSVLKNQNRQYYTFLMNTISITKLNNFEQNIDVYVLCSSCSESLWLSPEHKQFNIPLISITDLVYALDMNEEYYSFDLKQISSTIKMNENRTEDEENNAVVLKNPNSLLLTQRDGLNRGLLNNQTWWGLQITDNNTNDDENKEKNSIAELKEGKSGIASGYSHEKF